MYLPCTTDYTQYSKQRSMPVINMAFNVIARNLTELFLFKLVLLWSLSCFGPSQAADYGRQGLFTQIKGIIERSKNIVT